MSDLRNAATTAATAAARTAEVQTQGFLRRNVWPLLGLVVLLAGLAALLLAR